MAWEICRQMLVWVTHVAYHRVSRRQCLSSISMAPVSLPAPEDIQRFRGLRRTPRWVQLGATQEPRCGEEDGGPGSQVSLFLGQASFHPGGRSLVCGPDSGRPGLSLGMALAVGPRPGIAGGAASLRLGLR